jgi:chromosome segregation ATPase
MALAAKAAEYCALQSKIEEAKSRVISLNQQINSERTTITKTENALLLTDQQPPAITTESPIDPHTPISSGLNDAHDQILRSKRDEVSVLEEEVRELRKQKVSLEERLDELVAENDQYQAEITELTESIRSCSNENDRFSSECDVLDREIVERRNEVRMLERVQADADTAFGQLRERAEKADIVEGGRLELERTIENLRAELDCVAEEAKQITDEIALWKEDDEEEVRRSRVEQGTFEAILDWKTEREKMQKQLTDLQKEICERREGVTNSEQKVSQKQASLAKYGHVLTKWKGKIGEVPVPAKSLGQLWGDLEDAKKRSQDIIQKAERDMTDILTRNAKLEEDVAKRKERLERTVNQFYAEENQFKRRVEEKRAHAEAEEAKLLRQIDEARLKLAQKRLPKQ